MRVFLQSFSGTLLVILLAFMLLWFGFSNMGFADKLGIGKTSDDDNSDIVLLKNINALRDTLRVVRHNQEKILYETSSLTGYDSDLKNLERIGQIDEQQRQWIREIRHMKNVLSRVEAEIRVIDSVTVSTQQRLGYRLNGDSISFKRGQLVSWHGPDTSALKWQANTVIDSTMDLNLAYDYILNMDVRHVKNDDGTISVMFESSDPNLKMEGLNSYIIPPGKDRTKVGQWLYDNRTLIRATSGVVIFTAGGYVGYKMK